MFVRIYAGVCLFLEYAQRNAPLKLGLYRNVTRTNVRFFDPSPNLVVRSKNGYNQNYFDHNLLCSFNISEFF